jgi:hypothetical protein
MTLWTLTALAHVAILAALTWRGLLFARPWFTACLACSVASYAALCTIPHLTNLYFYAWLVAEIIDLSLHALVAREAHAQRIAALGPCGRMGWYSLLAALLVAFVFTTMMLAWGQLADPHAQWAVRSVQVGRGAIKVTLFSFTLFSCFLLDSTAEAVGPARLHQRMLLLWVGLSLFGALAQVTFLGADFRPAAVFELVCLTGWAWLLASGAFDGVGDQAANHRA